MEIDGPTSVVPDARAQQGGQAQRTVDAKSVGGNFLPPDGTGAPAPPQAPVQREVPTVDISRAIHVINAFLQDNQRGLRFQVDQDSGLTIITVVDSVSGEVVRQIPEQEMLKVARQLKLAGALVNARA